ncbi:MAG: hypothetical protein ACOYOS_21500 [Syntrophales bacterium]
MTFDSEQPMRITKKYFNIAPCHVVETAIEMKANSMVALDFPIRKIKDPVEREREFRKKLGYNVSWAIETAKLRKELCPNIDLFIPVQAYNLEQFDEFYAKIRGVDFDGFSLPVRNMSMLDIAAFLFKMHTWGIRKVHILGSTSLPVIIVCAYMSKRFFDFVSFDATTWRASAQYGVFLQPSDLSSKKLNKVRSCGSGHKCHCSACKGKTLCQIAALGRKETMTILMTHNYLAIENLCKEFEKEPVHLDFLRKRFKNSNRRDIPKILCSMSEIEAMCSMRQAA